MKNETTRLTRDQFERFNVYYPSNIVIIKMPPEKEIKTLSGISVGFNPDVQYAEGESSHPADCAAVYGWVAKQVERLYYNKKDINRSMSWKTTIETQVDDTVWLHALASKNCEEIHVEDEVYKVLRYEDLFVAKRERWISKFDGKKTTDVIPLNGNVILEAVYKPKLSEFDVLDPEVDLTRGIVKYNGSDNQAYQSSNRADLSGLKEGDMIMIDKNAYPFYLERSKYNSNFDGNKQYLVVQKRDIHAVL